mgnify:CR=1 FL=1
MHIFFQPDVPIPPVPDSVEDTAFSPVSAVLSEEESMHCAKVLRLSAGSPIRLTNGKGYWFDAVVTMPHAKRCGIEITGMQFCEPRHRHLHLAIAPTKNIDRFEWFLEKATEIGIGAITPLLCEHSERKNVNPERLERILVSAMKQSMQPWIPTLNPLTSITELIASATEPMRFIAHCEDGPKHTIQELYTSGEPVLILIGPEGDFSPAEIQTALEAHFRPVTLGHHRLRTETAGVTATHTIALLNYRI